MVLYPRRLPLRFFFFFSSSWKRYGSWVTRCFSDGFQAEAGFNSGGARLLRSLPTLGSLAQLELLWNRSDCGGASPCVLVERRGLYLCISGP